MMGNEIDTLKNKQWFGRLVKAFDKEQPPHIDAILLDNGDFEVYIFGGGDSLVFQLTKEELETIKNITNGMGINY